MRRRGAGTVDATGVPPASPYDSAPRWRGPAALYAGASPAPPHGVRVKPAALARIRAGDAALRAARGSPPTALADFASLAARCPDPQPEVTEPVQARAHDKTRDEEAS